MKHRIFILINIFLLVILFCGCDNAKKDFINRIDGINKVEVLKFENNYLLEMEKVEELKDIINSRYNESNYTIEKTDKSGFDVVLRVSIRKDKMIIAYLKETEALYFSYDWIMDEYTEPIDRKTLIMRVDNEIEQLLKY